MPNIGGKKNLIGQKLKKTNKTPKPKKNQKNPTGLGFFKKNPGFCQPCAKRPLALDVCIYIQ
jgi:hypothetical protein